MAAGHPVTFPEAAVTHAGHVVEIGAQTVYVERGVVVAPATLAAAAATGVPSVLARALKGQRLRLWDGVLFGTILVIPRSVDVGAVVSLASFPVEVWNADEIAHLCQSVGVSGSDGVAVVAGPTLPTYWPPFTSFFSTVDVAAEGEPNIDSLVTWVFPGFAGTDCHVLGVRLTVYPLEPEWDTGLDEGFGYLVDVLSARNATEQRIALRVVPERTLAFTGIAANVQQAAALVVKLLNEGMLLFTVPYWPDAVHPGADVAAGATVLVVDTTTRIFEVGGLVILWRDSLTWETGKIVAFDAGSITLRSATLSAWPKASSLIMPLLPARLTDVADVEDVSPGVKQIAATFRTEPPGGSLSGSLSPPPPPPPPPLAPDLSVGVGQAVGQPAVNATTDVTPGLGYGILLAQVCWLDPAGTTEFVTAVTCDGAPMSFVPGTLQAVGNVRTAWYSLLDPAAGTRSVTATFSGSVTCTLGLQTFVGVDQASPFGSIALNTGTSSFPSVNVSVAAGNLSAWGAVSDDGSTSVHYNLPTDPTIMQIDFHAVGSSPNRMSPVAGYDTQNGGLANIAVSQSASKPWGMVAIELQAA